MRARRYSPQSGKLLVFRQAWILITALLVTGCATHLPMAERRSTPHEPQPVELAAVSPTKLVETRYDVRGYREAASPSIRHDAHAVYRRTTVPITIGEDLAMVPRTSYPATSYAPLSDSDELMAEIVTQKAITAELRAMQASVVETERRVQAQYATLVRQSSEAAKLRDQLEAELARVRAASPVPTTPTAERTNDGKSAEVKW